MLEPQHGLPRCALQLGLSAETVGGHVLLLPEEVSRCKQHTMLLLWKRTKHVSKHNTLVRGPPANVSAGLLHAPNIEEDPLSFREILWLQVCSSPEAQLCSMWQTGVIIPRCGR